MPVETVLMQEPDLPDPAALAAWQAEIAAARRNPWLASLFMRRLDALQTRLAELRDWLASLPRRLRRGWARGWTRRWALALPAAALVLALASWAAMAKMDNTITVGTGGCTLAAAITAANNDAVAGSCPMGSGADTINFANPNGTYGYTSALPDITTDVTIQGNGNTTIQRTGGPAFSVLRVIGNTVNFSVFTLENATISGGSATKGGGIYARDRAYLYVTDVTISGNTASGAGGGIYASRRLTLTNCTISGNSAGGAGGGVYAPGVQFNLTNTTISGNSAGGAGGGIHATGATTAFLTNATISGNSAVGAGGGINALNAGVFVRNSIVAGQTAGADCAAGSNMISYGYNIESAASCGFTATGDQQNVASGQLNLVALALNAPGTTRTQSLGPGSVALDHIPNGTSYCGTSINTDQRGVARPQPAGGACDVGAFESRLFTLDVVLAGTGGGMVTSAPPGIACPGDCSEGPFDDATITLTPTAAPGSVFAGWSGDCAGGGPFDVQMLADRTCTATFDVAPPTAAQVTHFAAAPDPTGRIRITWETAAEVDVAAFRIERAPSDPPSPHSPPSPPRPHGPWATISPLIPARGSAAGGARYVATDSPGVGSFAYRLVVVNAGGPPATQAPVGTVVRALRAFLPFASAR